ncbi:MAG: hypothetical protein EZS28_041607 [Streblomastix strix]|uniref:Uncharacterized protein n=1 Tax=Streblomastix strix TaxID=222440 RepID=A0A5J4TWL4_9EUKA|nr:MAG: hypothetical protein EZS28_041607 [Streblomastix strix]
MIYIIFALLASMKADNDPVDTTIEFPRYSFNSTAQILTWDKIKAEDVVKVDWNEGPYPFGSYGSPELNVFDKQGLTINEDTIAIREDVDTQNPTLPYDQYEYFKGCLYEFQAAVIAAYYGLNIVPSENYLAECGPTLYIEKLTPPAENGYEIHTFDYPAFVGGVNDAKCYGARSEDGKCKTQCVNGDPIKKGNYGKDLLTLVSSYVTVQDEEQLKRIIAKFGPVYSLPNTIYGWKKFVEGTKFLSMYREHMNGKLIFNEQPFSHIYGCTVAYAETFPEKLEAYNPIHSDPQGKQQCTTDTIPSDGCFCTKDKHPTGCTCPEDLTDIPKESCPCPVTIDEHDKDPRKDGICKCPEKGSDEYDTDPRTKKGLACSSGVVRSALSVVMMTLIVPILVLHFL